MSLRFAVFSSIQTGILWHADNPFLNRVALCAAPLVDLLLGADRIRSPLLAFGEHSPERVFPYAVAAQTALYAATLVLPLIATRLHEPAGSVWLAVLVQSTSPFVALLAHCIFVERRLVRDIRWFYALVAFVGTFMALPKTSILSVVALFASGVSAKTAATCLLAVSVLCSTAVQFLRQRHGHMRMEVALATALLFAPFAEWRNLPQPSAWIPVFICAICSWAASRSEANLVADVRADPFKMAAARVQGLALLLLFGATTWQHGSPLAACVVFAACYRAVYQSPAGKPKSDTMTAVKKPLVIGISGKIGSGKSTLADALRKAAGGTRAIEVNFADALKREVADLYNIPLKRCYDQDEKNKPINEREHSQLLGAALQRVGSERREHNADYWVAKVQSAIDADTEHDAFIVADVRFANEARWIKKNGGVLVRLNGDPGGVRKRSQRDATHASETSLDDYDAFDFVFDTEKKDAESIAKLVLQCLE